MNAATSGLIGTAIGALASGIGVYVQQKPQDRRERQKMTVELATLEYNRDFEPAKAVEGGAFVAPLASYVICNAELLDAIAEKEMSSEKIRQLVERNNTILSAFPRPKAE